MNNANLIKTVRGLDQSGPGPDGEGLQLLWSCLAASADSQFHAAEESSLRWLLKSMNGPSSAAELTRRYPLTWTILDCVFQRIPLFSLAKSLADRKFIAVLQQTLKGVSKPAAGSRSPASSKRKRTPTAGYDLEALQAPVGCLETAQIVFKALKSLLSRLENSESALTRDTIGAQHIRSLFCNSAAEATGIAAPALTICSMLTSSPGGDVKGAESWIETISTIWDLHLQGGDDEVEVAIHLFRPSATILARLGSFPSDQQVELPEALKTRWSADLQTFMQRNLIIPGRAAFMTHRVFESFTQALEISRNVAQLSAPALYFLSSRVSSRIAEGELRKDNVEWLKQIFHAIELTIRGRPDSGTLMQTILELAIQRSTPVDVQNLRRVCRDYAMRKAETDWELIAKVAACDPDVFQLSDDGASLRREVCDRILKQEAAEAHYKPIAKVIGAIIDGFRARRSLTGFLRLWFEQLCEAERQQTNHHSPWFDVGRFTSPTQSLDSLLETELSPSQLLDIIAWTGTQNPTKHPRSTCVFSAAIAQALRGESFVDAVGSRLFDLVAPVDGSMQASALKWRVVSSTMSWVASDERVETWNSVKDQLSNILKTTPIISSVTFEAFKCCFRAWDSLSLDEAHVDEAASIIENFNERLAAEMAGRRILSGDELSFLDPDMKAELQEDSAYQQYLSWYICGSSRFNRLYYNRKEGIPLILTNALSNQNDGVSGLETLWRTLLRNEVNLNESKIARDFIDRLIVALESSKEKKGWPGKQSLLSIKILSSIPLEVFDRGQRERLMNVLSKRRSKMVQSPEQVSLFSWKIVLGLATKMMGRPTFYEGMGFSDLVEIAEAMSRISIEPQSGSEAVVELTERFFLMASATIRQMAENIDERSIRYFRGASQFVSDHKARGTTQPEAHTARQPLHMTLLKALAAELARSPSWQNQQDMASLSIDSKAVLASCIMDVMRKLMSEKNLLASPSIGVDMSLFAAVDAAAQAGDFTGQPDFKPSAVRNLEKRSRRLMQQGDMRGWKIQVFLRTYLSAVVEVPRPTAYDSLGGLSGNLRQPLLREELLDGFKNDSDTDGQVLAIQTVVDQLIDSVEVHERDEGFNLAAAHSELTLLLLQKPTHARQVCHILRTLLEKRPQAMGQWNVEVTLSAVCDLCSMSTDGSAVPFAELCKLVEIVIKKHRLRLEGHYHILLSAMQALLCNLVIKQIPADRSDERSQVSKSHAYARLISLICEPTAGAVSRSQLHSALDSATDTAKRSAGRHMFLVLMQYVKLQLEENVPRAAREALEPAMNSIFDITSPEGRKILNDAMDGSGRAILREMFKRYVKFGKWSGV
ncbi:urb2/Npa2 family protein [Hirsutella rhossiliensis]|uniref:Urb2/Npa2 family domain-containing protein n=1 Tax=Hirsutella rhossiliensis TaxID=111463 RepID=A0A9P8N780_9HYPO|nr:urb2/Npa2 family domain-containing protein [Hirsutella rhossiliensis]KAH0965907.1 urb2/Npa2 family domain-containing protein [Hirsutella rhossiliensis]